MKYWNDKGVTNIDMVGYRSYKLKYNPDIIEIPVIIFQKYPFLMFGKKVAMKIIQVFRNVKGKLR